MGRKISTFYAEGNKGYCEVHMDLKEELCYIKYFDSNGNRFYTEEFPNKSLRYVENAAEDWALGIKKLINEDVYLAG